VLYAAAIAFVLFGLWLLLDGALGLRWVALGVTAAAAVATATAAVVAYVPSRREHPLELPPLESSPDPGAPRLATVGQTTDQLPTVGSLSGVTCRGAHRRNRTPVARVDN
jgi:hypothetical protein